MKVNDYVWIRQRDYPGTREEQPWVLGQVKGFTPKMIKVEDLTRGDYTQSKSGVGNFLPKNVKLLTQEELDYRDLENGKPHNYNDKGEPKYGN